MPSPNVQLVQSIYDAFAAGDVAAVLARFSPDIVWNEAENSPYADANPCIGPDAVVQGVFARCINEWDGFTVAIDEILDAGHTIVALGRYHGTFKATGRAQHTQLVHIWRIEAGKAIAFQQHADTLHLAHVTTRSSTAPRADAAQAS